MCKIVSRCSQLNEKEFLKLAYNKIEELVIKAELYEDKNVDITSTENIIKINRNNQSIVINTQTPNRQLWYSSTISGPQRFNYDVSTKTWVNSVNLVLDEVMENDI
jgi:frataxin